jgi:hypothetical protein
VVRGGR